MSTPRSLLRPVRDRLQEGSCRRGDVKSEWWTDEHTHRGHNPCDHFLAEHICRDHCPVLVECEEDMIRPGTDWTGMVVAGKVRVKPRKPAPVIPDYRKLAHCPLCP